MYLCVHNRVVQIWGASSVSGGGRREGEDAFAGGREGGIESSSKEFEAYTCSSMAYSKHYRISHRFVALELLLCTHQITQIFTHYHPAVCYDLIRERYLLA